MAYDKHGSLRICELPAEEQGPFSEWLDRKRKDRPWLRNVLKQDGFYLFDYARWKKTGRVMRSYTVEEF